MPTMTPELHEILQRFDSLPDDSVVSSRISAIILGVSERTVRYHPNLPRIKVSAGRYGQRVRDLRSIVRGGLS
jgi:hypothetical protein